MNKLNLEIIRLIEKLKTEKIIPMIHGTDLSLFGDQGDELIKFIQSYSVLKKPENIRQVLLWKLNMLENRNRPEIGGVKSKDIFRPLSGIDNAAAELLYNSIFNQKEFLSTLENPIEIVLFRRGRSGRALTNLLKALPNVNTTILLSGTDDSGSWFEGSRLFRTPGIPGLGKALLDLAGDRHVKEFLSIEITNTGENISVSFNNLIHRLKDPGNNHYEIRNNSIRKAFFAALKIDIVKRKLIRSYLDFFRRDCKDALSSLECIPFRSIIIQGAYYYYREKNKNVSWKEIIDELSTNLFSLGEGSKVFFVTEERQHLVALDAMGTLYFSENAITYYHDTFHDDIPFIGMWLINESVDDNFINSLVSHIEGNYSGAQKIIDDMDIAAVPEPFRERTQSTIRRFDIKYLDDIKKYMDRKSSNNAGISKELKLEDEVVGILRRADIIIFSDAYLETNIAGSLLVPDLKDVLKGTSNLKICLLGMDSDDIDEIRAQLKAERNLENIYRYLVYNLNPLKKNDWKELHQFINYTIGVIGDSLDSNIHNFTADTVFTQYIDKAKDSRYGFFLATAQAEIILSLLGITKAGFVVDSQYGLMSQNIQCTLNENEENNQRMKYSGFGLFDLQQVKRSIQNVSSNLYDGCFCFDVDMTMLPKKAEFLTDYPELAYLFTQLLRIHVPVAIISGNSKEEQIPRIIKAIQQEMKNDKFGFENLTFYVDGGATKIKFDNNGDCIEDTERRHNNKIDPESYKTIKNAIDSALKDIKNDINIIIEDKKQQELFKKEAAEKYQDLDLIPFWDVESWEPEWVTPKELQDKKKKKEKIVFPWVEVRGKTEDDNTIASIAIKPTPMVEGDMAFDIRDELQRRIIEKLGKENQFNIRSGGRSTTDITLKGADKTAAVKDFIDSNDLAQRKVYYFGDEFYERDSQLGNDEVIARDPNLSFVQTFAVNSDNIDGAHDKTIWIGRSPQAVLEFLEKVVPE
ncbi:MAG: hypothetical protein JW881_21425 [Spirochaetales bacterium]|nr:hypothetical protein [Spirochaetales bacterium]